MLVNWPYPYSSLPAPAAPSRCVGCGRCMFCGGTAPRPAIEGPIWVVPPDPYQAQPFHPDTGRTWVSDTAVVTLCDSVPVSSGTLTVSDASPTTASAAFTFTHASV